MTALTSIVLSAALAATGTPSAPATTDPPLRHTRWVVEALVNGDTVEPAPAVPTAHLVFGDDTDLTGKVNCRTLIGSATVHPDMITFGAIGTTKQLCPVEDWSFDVAVLTVLGGDVAYEIGDGRLVLDHPSGRGLWLRAEAG